MPRKATYTFWIGRLDSESGELELWLEFFEPSQALDWKKRHFRGEDDVICVEHHESGKLSSSGRRTIKYWPEWANGDNWRRVTSDSVAHIESIKMANASRAQKAREAKRLRDVEEKRRHFELSQAKREAYGMTETEHNELTAKISEGK